MTTMAGTNLPRFGAALLIAALAVGSSVGTADAQGRGTAAVKKLAPEQTAGVSKASVKSRNAGAANTNPNPAKPALVGNFGDWGVYVSQSPKSKICYALAQPKDRSPATLKRESAYVFISNRPGEGVRGEVSMIMGVALKDGASGAKAEIGSAKFELVAKGQNAFIKNAAEETQFVSTLKKRGSRLVISVPVAKGPGVTDTYSLAGLSQALDRVSKECP